jgi:hypothetical protein
MVTIASWICLLGHTVKETNKADVASDVSDVVGGNPKFISVTIDATNPLDSTGNDFVNEKTPMT